MAGLGVARRGKADEAGRGEAWRGGARQTGRGRARHGRARRGKADAAGLGEAWRGRARQGRHGMARRGWAGPGMARQATRPRTATIITSLNKRKKHANQTNHFRASVRNALNVAGHPGKDDRLFCAAG